MPVKKHCTLVGSPPHTRGILCCRCPRDLSSRITPAHAGNTLAYQSCFGAHQDHPRTRGEYASQSCLQGAYVGSPPHTRGIRIIMNMEITTGRITPAHAGNTIATRGQIILLKDHPRTRGEYAIAVITACVGSGSPPHTRGIQKVWITSRRWLRMDYFPKMVEDHPRTRGEYPTSRMPSKTSLGSPPHTRGIHVRGERHQFFSGITPAHAGNTLKKSLNISVSKNATLILNSVYRRHCLKFCNRLPPYAFAFLLSLNSLQLSLIDNSPTPLISL